MEPLLKLDSRIQQARNWCSKLANESKPRSITYIGSKMTNSDVDWRSMETAGESELSSSNTLFVAVVTTLTKNTHIEGMDEGV
jgi:hypothetical protein